MESVNFLNVGIILNVTPQITPDNKVLMKVKPEVSTGQINPDTKLPDSKTTQVETSVLLPDGHGIVIGGLIQEEDIENQAKIPFLGDIWIIGWLFQHRETRREPPRGHHLADPAYRPLSAGMPGKGGSAVLSFGDSVAPRCVGAIPPAV